MKKKLTLLITLLICFASLVGAQSTRPPGPRRVVTKPAAPCSPRDFIQAQDTGVESICAKDGSAWKDLGISSGGSAGDMNGPATSTDEAVTRFNGTTGKSTQNSTVTISDAGLISGATVGTPTTSTQPANKTYVDSAVATIAGNIPKLSGLASGGGVIWESAYTFRVSAATYYINGVLYSSAEQTITLTAAHATLDRIDVLALNTAGTLVKIDGTASAQPSEPDYDPSTQLKLTFVFVGANTTQPAGVSNENVFLENTEWTSSTSGSGWNANSTNNPRTGTKDIEGTNVANGAYVQLQRGSSTALDSFGTLSLFIRSKATFNNNRVLRVQFFLSGVAKGNALTIADSFWGFDSSNTASYQLIAIPVAQFAIPSGTLVNQLRISDQGGALGVYIDDVVLQALGSTIAPPAQTGITQAQGDARYVQRANNLSDLNSASTARTNLGATTVGGNLFTATNPGAISFPKIAADNSVSFRTPAQLTSDLDAVVGDSGSGGTKGLVPAPATGDATKFLKGDGTWTSAGDTSAIGEFEKRPLRQIDVRPGTTAFDAVGLGTLGPFHDSASNQDDADGHWIQQHTAASTGSTCGMDANHAQLVRLGHKNTIVIKIKTGSSISNVRYWIGAFSSDPQASTDPTNHGIGFGYDTGIDGTAFWHTWSNDNSGGGSRTTTTQSIATSSVYWLAMKVVSTSSVEFYISTDGEFDDPPVATHTTNLPGTNGMNVYVELRTLDASAKHYRFSHVLIR